MLFCMCCVIVIKMCFVSVQPCRVLDNDAVLLWVMQTTPGMRATVLTRPRRRHRRQHSASVRLRSW